MSESVIITPEKRLVRGVGNMTQLMPAKYPWAWEWYLDRNANHWTPGEIQMGKDIYQFEHELNPSEKHVFTNVLAYLTTSDMLAMRNVSLAVMEKITAPEVQQALMAHGFDESIHSWTYQHCLECLKLDQHDIYTRYMRWPEINAKFELSNKYLKAALELHELKSKEDVEEFLYSYIFFCLIFEGVWFFNGFTPIFSMNARNKMTNTGEQLQYIFRDEVNHVKLGMNVIRGIIQEENITLDVNRIKLMFDEAMECEEKYIRMILKDGMVAYTPELHMQQSRFISNRRVRQLGLQPLYLDSEPAFKWLDEISGGTRKEKNFFETRVTEYQATSGLDTLQGAWTPEW